VAEDLQEKDSFGPSGNLGQNFLESRTSLAIFGFFFIGLFVFAFGAGLFVFGENKNDDIQIISASQDPNTIPEIVVDVAGAVANPGVYRLPADSRVSDAVTSAGGLAEEADRDHINLAAKVADGQKIHIFAKGETGLASGGQVSGESTGPVSINYASQSQLEELPGIGPVTAQKIIAARPYGAPEELVSKKAVSMSVYEKIKDLIAL
jgi:competence protein ComEA